MSQLFLDLRYAFRSFARRPGFALTIVVTVALATGGGTAVFTMLNGLWLEPLPFADPDRLLVLSMVQPEAGVEAEMSLPDLVDVANGCRACAAVGAADGFGAVLDGGQGPERLRGAAVTPGLFALLGVAPALGREFTAEEGRVGGPRVAVIGDGLWRRLGGEESVVGSTLHLDGRAVEVVGVMPPGFGFPEAEQVWRPLRFDPEEERTNRYLDLSLARLADGATPAALGDELEAIAARLAADHPVTNRGWGLRTQPLRQALVGDSGAMLAVLLGAVGFLLLAACANVANLLLAREGSRRREMAVRSALGAGTGRLVRQLLTESVLLSLAGGAAGLLLAVWSLDLLLATNPEPFQYWMRFEVDGTVLAVSFAVALATGVLFGILPALRAAGPDVRSALAAGGRTGGDVRGGDRLRRTLVAVEVALSVSLLFGATLLVQSYAAQLGGDAGFDTGNLLSFRTVMIGERYAEPVDRAAFLDRMVERLEGVPGVERAAATGALPIDDGGGTVAVEAEGRPLDAGHEIYATYVGSTAGFFATLGLEPLAGRGFTRAEALDPQTRVAMINRALAERLWPGVSPLGRRVRFDGDDELWFDVVGVAPDLHYEEFGEETVESRLQVHLPAARAAWTQMAVLVRTAGDPAALAGEVRRAFAAADGTLPVFELRTMERVRRETTWGQAVVGGILAYFALLGVLLAAVGVYGVVAFAVARRVREIGVRMAVGSSPGQVVRRFVGEGVGQALAGVVAGLALAALLARLLAGFLYGVGAYDPRTFLAVVVTLAVVTVAASWVPARRAAAVDPMTALRAE